MTSGRAEYFEALCKSTGVGLVGFVFALFAINVALFFLGQTIGAAPDWIAMAVAAVLAAGFANRCRLPPALTALSGIAAVAIVLAAVWICSSVYGLSWDGISYHQEGVIQLARGWNPYHENLDESVAYSLWLNPFPKLSWIIAASQYAAFGNIESGKCYSLILAAAVALLALPLLRRFVGASWLWRTVLVALLLLNPILINQILTYYVDGFVYLLYVLVCIAAAYAILERGAAWNLLFIVSGVLLINAKFTGVPYFGLIALLIIAFLVLRLDLHEAFRISTLAAVSVVAATIVFGFEPYVRNTLEHANPLYPSIGPGALDMMGPELPIEGFEKVAPPVRFLESVFSVVSNPVHAESVHLRWPFLIESAAEIDQSAGFDTRLSGMGFWFSGIFVTALAALVYLGLSRAGRVDRLSAVYFPCGVLLTVLLVPPSWWARFVPQLWLFPVLVVLFLRMSGTRTAHVFSWVLVGTMVVNSGLILHRAATWTHKENYLIKKELTQLASSPGTPMFRFGEFPAIRARLDDRHIKYAVLPERIVFNGIITVVDSGGRSLPCPEPVALTGTFDQVKYCR